VTHFRKKPTKTFNSKQGFLPVARKTVKGNSMIRRANNRKFVNSKVKLSQIQGFRNCLNLWFEKSFPNFKGEIISKTFDDKMNRIHLEKIVKTFKTFLSGNFSHYMKQEMPPVDKSFFLLEEILSSRAKLRFITLF